MSLIRSFPLQVLEQSLKASSLREKVLANNIANVDTPNFKRSDVSFASQLKTYLNSSTPQLTGIRTSPRQFAIGVNSIHQVQPKIITESSTSVTNNGNNVQIDSEMAQLAKNQLLYNTLVQGVITKLSQLNSVINGGL